jgi:hypothetical protein
MHRFIAGFPASLLLGALASTAAADVVPTGAASATNAASPASATAAQEKGYESSRTEPSPATGSVPLRRIVCLSASLQCFRVTSAATGASGLAKPLDLRAPDIRTLVSEAELRQRVDDDWAISEREDEQQVRVEGARPDIYVPGGLAALGWAAMHPTQVWRIFLPVPASQTK